MALLSLLCRPAFAELLLELQEQLQALRREQQVPPPSLPNSSSGIVTDSQPSNTTLASPEEPAADA